MQPPSLWYQSHPYRHHHPGTSSHHHPGTPSNHPARCGSNGAGQGAAALTGSSGRPDTPRHHHIELLPCKVWKQWSGAGMQPPSLAPVATAKRICMIKPIFSLTYKFGRPRHIITTSSHHHPDITTPTPRVTTLQGMEALERGRGAAALTGNTGHPYRHHHPDIITPTHRVTTLQGMEAMERGRVQPPSLWYQCHTYPHRHIDTPSYHRGRPLA